MMYRFFPDFTHLGVRVQFWNIEKKFEKFLFRLRKKDEWISFWKNKAIIQ